MSIIYQQRYIGSFNDTMQMCILAKERNSEVKGFIMDRWITVKPGDDASVVYRSAFPEYFTETV